MSAFPGKPPRLEQFFAEAPIFFVTFNVHRRRSVLADVAVHQAFRGYASKARAFRVLVGRYVIMPDHIHLFVAGPPTFDLGMWVRGLKRAISNASAIPIEWQPGFFDHVLRGGESYESKWMYVRANPARAGLVATWSDWPYQGEVARIEGP